jgi:hypothetical protein
MKKLKIIITNMKLLSTRNVFIPSSFMFMTMRPWNLTFIKMGAKLGTLTTNVVISLRGTSVVTYKRQLRNKNSHNYVYY